GHALLAAYCSPEKIESAGPGSVEPGFSIRSGWGGWKTPVRGTFHRRLPSSWRSGFAVITVEVVLPSVDPDFRISDADGPRVRFVDNGRFEPSIRETSSEVVKVTASKKSETDRRIGGLGCRGHIMHPDRSSTTSV